MAGFERPADEHGAFARLRQHLQAAQLFWPRLRQPGHDGGCRIGAQHLLRRPQALRGRVHTDPNQLLLLDTEMAHAGEMQRLRGTDDDQCPSALEQRAQ